jgi:hypothetical protein
VAISEPSRTTTATTRPRQQEDVVAVTAQALSTRDPHQGRSHSRMESRGARSHRAAKTPVSGDSAPRGVRSGVAVRSAPGPALGVLVVRSDGCVMLR